MLDISYTAWWQVGERLGGSQGDASGEDGEGGLHGDESVVSGWTVVGVDGGEVKQWQDASDE